MAKRTGGRVQPGSGCITNMKGDVKTPHWLIEVKMTCANSYILKRGVLDKIEREGLKSGKLPVLVVDIAGRRYGVLRAQDLPDELGAL